MNEIDVVFGELESELNDLRAQNSELALILTQKTMEAAEAEARCKHQQAELSRLSATVTQSLSSKEDVRNRQLQQEYSRAVRDVAAYKELDAIQSSKITALSENLETIKSALHNQLKQQQEQAATAFNEAADNHAEKVNAQQDELNSLSQQLQHVRSDKLQQEQAHRQQVQTLVQEQQQLQTTLEKERRASALNNAARGDSVWKAKLMQMSAELEKVKTEKDKYKRICKKQQGQSS